MAISTKSAAILLFIVGFHLIKTKGDDEPISTNRRLNLKDAVQTTDEEHNRQEISVANKEIGFLRSLSFIQMVMVKSLMCPSADDKDHHALTPDMLYNILHHTKGHHYDDEEDEYSDDGASEHIHEEDEDIIDIINDHGREEGAGNDEKHIFEGKPDDGETFGQIVLDATVEQTEDVEVKPEETVVTKKWLITFITESEPGAGFSSAEGRIVCVIYGSMYDSEPIYIDIKPGELQPGSRHQYPITTTGVIEPLDIEIGVLSSNDSWELKKIKLRDLTDKVTYVARPHCWLGGKHDSMSIVWPLEVYEKV